MEWSTVSTAADKSRRMSEVTSSWFIARMSSLWILRRVVSVESKTRSAEYWSEGDKELKDRWDWMREAATLKKKLELNLRLEIGPWIWRIWLRYIGLGISMLLVTYFMRSKADFQRRQHRSNRQRSRLARKISGLIHEYWTHHCWLAQMATKTKISSLFWNSSRKVEILEDGSREMLRKGCSSLP